MRITFTTTNFVTPAKTNKTEKKQNTYYTKNYFPSFGYCDIHMGRMRTANENIRKTIMKSFSEYSKLKQQFDNYNKKLDFIKNAQKQAAFLITQYTNYQYSLAEVIPSYALESSSELMQAIEETQIFNSPHEILLTIANIPKLETQSGIDKHTGKPYTKEQARKSRANSQLYSTAIMLDLLDKKIETTKLRESDKSLIMDMRNSILNSISSIYGTDAYAKIQSLKMMGINASVEDKKASLNLLQEFDSKAKDLDFGKEFYNNLDKLIKHQEVFGTNLEKNIIAEMSTIPKVTLHYHTHAHEHEHTHEHGHSHNHKHEHDNHTHEYMHKHGIEHNHNHSIKLEKK